VVTEARNKDQQSVVMLFNTARCIQIIFELEELLINPINGAQSIGIEQAVGVFCFLMGVSASPPEKQ
jgi:hypothetical protein